MSTRYVWNRHDIKNTTTYSRVKQGDTNDINGIYIVKGSDVRIASSYTINQSTGLFQAAGNNKFMKPDEYAYCDQYPYAFCQPYGTTTIDYATLYEAPSHSDRYHWGTFDNNTRLNVWDGDDNERTSFPYYGLQKNTSQSAGAQNGVYSSAINNTYPSNGISGSYWYVYRGSDNIDPSISYDNKQTLTKEVTISLTPSTSIQYGGTITYDYQVNIDGTNWVDIGSTTATSMNYTIPATATQFQARVRARDNMGFTSTTWVTGPLATVAPPYIRTRLRRKNASGTYDLIHLMTSADSVVQDDGSNVQDIINNIKQRLNLS